MAINVILWRPIVDELFESVDKHPDVYDRQD